MAANLDDRLRLLERRMDRVEGRLHLEPMVEPAVGPAPWTWEKPPAPALVPIAEPVRPQDEPAQVAEETPLVLDELVERVAQARQARRVAPPPLP